ncbi:acylphosphatase [Nesidiocoris tenuis]|uniref:Acylphosphatase n=1 Tax=Nesidiocoris tenuis TaxID=355587 RepID=A0ABN7AYW2_9HEMI|nr:acylphosphatase [Nesidiocoris tenuis]
MSKFSSVDFEVHGKVQGVFFRKFAQKRAQELGLSGFVQNTPKGTVIGHVEGDRTKVQQMKQWLEKVGSPKSRIDKTVFADEKPVSQLAGTGFIIKQT